VRWKGAGSAGTPRRLRHDRTRQSSGGVAGQVGAGPVDVGWRWARLERTHDALVLDMGEDPIDDSRVGNHGDDPHRASAFRTHEGLDFEDVAQKASP